MMLRRLLILSTLAGAALAQSGPKPWVPDPGKLEEALAKARESHQRVLLFYGGPWCTGCSERYQAWQADPEIARLLKAYVGVHLHTADGAGVTGFARRQRVELKPESGPLVAVVDQDGALLGTTAGDGAKVKALLARYEPGEPAAALLEKALPGLRQTGTLGWVEIRADWCGWCRKMEAFFGRSAAAPVLQKYYTMIPLDLDRNQGALAVTAKLGEKGNEGEPWFAIVDAEGKPLATSTGPKGNIGFPGTPEEYAHFMAVIQGTAKGISTAELETIEKAVRAVK
jgi:hypothetical protein